MDIQQYFEVIVYPECEFILDQYKGGKINKEVALKLANFIIDLDKVVLDYNKSLAPIMVADTMKWFLQEVENI